MTSEKLSHLKATGFMDTTSILVTNNVFDIPNRLKALNPNFFVVFNPSIQLYELHDESQAVTHNLTFPFEELDGRCIDYARERMIERADIIFKEIQAKNAKIESDNEKKFIDDVGQVAKEIHTHAIRDSGDGGLDKGAYKTKFI